MLSDPVQFDELLKAYPQKMFTLDNREIGFDVLEEYVLHDFPLYRSTDYHLATRVLINYLSRGHVGKYFKPALELFWEVVNGFYTHYYGMSKIDTIKYKLKIKANSRDEFWDGVYVREAINSFAIFGDSVPVVMKSNVHKVFEKIKDFRTFAEVTRKAPIDFAVSKKTKDYWRARYNL